MLGKARVIAFALAMLASPVALAQGSFTNGQTLFTDNACGDCHEFLGATGLQAIRDQIAQRTTPQPGLNYTKSLMALTAALGGTDLDNDATGMDAMFMFTDAQRLDLATYIANLPNPTPIVSYSPAVGAVFSATAVGATSTQTVTVTNTGNAALIFATNGAATIATGPFSADFSVSTSQASSFCQSVTLQPGVGSCTVMVQFSPQRGRRHRAPSVAGACYNSPSDADAGVDTGQPSRGATACHAAWRAARRDPAALEFREFTVRRRGFAVASPRLAARPDSRDPSPSSAVGRRFPARSSRRSGASPGLAPAVFD